MAYTHWLIKAEPETRIERGVDVKFSIDDLEQKTTTTWEGVRNHQAKKFLRDEMKLGHECLFYASNCKEPGVRGIARVCKEGYPDYNAWDPKHPYYDPKSKEDKPTWYMVDVEFVSRLTHPVPLALLQLLATHAAPSSGGDRPLPPALSAYLTPTHLSAIASSALISRGRLSVQPVSDEFWDAVVLLGEQGGWDEWEEWKEKKGAGGKKGKKAGAGTGAGAGGGKAAVAARKAPENDGEGQGDRSDANGDCKSEQLVGLKKKKRSQPDDESTSAAAKLGKASIEHGDRNNSITEAERSASTGGQKRVRTRVGAATTAEGAGGGNGDDASNSDADADALTTQKIPRRNPRRSSAA